jgi:catechol 2,3-dioxygenase-like lactoylglutathione lyase family enzyme
MTFDHVTIRASDRPASERFYETVLRALGIEKGHSDRDYAEWDDFSLSQADGEHPPTRRLHIAFVAASRADVDEFWRVGTQAGYRDDGEPGPRSQYRYDYYGSFLLDPDGNSVEAVHHGAMRGGGIDHLWLRVADVAAAKRFYETVAPYAGLRLNSDTADRAQFMGDSGSFSLVPGEPTEHLHLAFRQARTPRWTPSTERPPKRATPTTAPPASGPSTTPATTAPSCSTRTGTTSRS